MNLKPFAEFYFVSVSAAAALGDLILIGIFLYGFFRSRKRQLGFLLFAIANAFQFYVQAYWFFNHIKTAFDVNLFSFWAWRYMFIGMVVTEGAGQTGSGLDILHCSGHFRAHGKSVAH